MAAPDDEKQLLVGIETRNGLQCGNLCDSLEKGNADRKKFKIGRFGDWLNSGGDRFTTACRGASGGDNVLQFKGQMFVRLDGFEEQRVLWNKKIFDH